MNLLFVILLLTCTEARKKRPKIPSGGVDIYPEKFDRPIDFGHVYRDGYIPHGAEERDPRDIPDVSEIRRLKYEKPREGAIFHSPRDEYEAHRRLGDVPSINIKPGREKMWLDFPSLLQRNFEMPNVARMDIATPRNRQRPRQNQNDRPEVESDKSQYFSRSSFGVDTRVIVPDTNWTTCDEFGTGAKFHPAYVLDIQWLPFYTWTNGVHSTAYLNEFRRPTQKLVTEYKENYGPYLNKKINWEQPKLLHRMLPLKQQLLIAADKKGLFYVIRPIDLPEHVIGTDLQLPIEELRLKIINKYLLLMSCDDEERHISVMTANGEGPSTDEEKITIAKTFNILGDGIPVSRNPDIEAYKIRDNQKRKEKENSDRTIRLDQNYGMFAPKDLTKNEDVTRPKDEPYKN